MMPNIGFTCGAFDLLHVGHISMLEYCARQCDRLVVGLHTNPAIDRPDTKNVPVQTMYERWVHLMALSCVTQVIPYDTEQDLKNLLATQDIHIRFIGEEYRQSLDFVTGIHICQDRRITLHFVPARLHNYSSSNMRHRVALAEAEKKPYATPTVQQDLFTYLPQPNPPDT